MAEAAFLTDEFLRQLTAVGEVDLLVGVPTANNRDTIQQIIKAVQIGLVKYFPRQRTVLINPDGGSHDGTPEVVANSSIPDFRTVLAANPLRTSHVVATAYHPSRGTGEALRLILAAADLLRAKACAIVTPNLISVAPEWIDALLRPVYREGFDLVAPVYERHKFDGLLIKNILSPFIRAAYGYEIQEPVGGEFGFSGALACHFLAQDVWQADFMRSGWAVWITTTALSSSYRPCQSFLGPRLQASKSPDQALPATIQSIVGALFSSLEAHEQFWLSQNGAKIAPVFGFQSELDLGPVRVNRKRMFEMFRTGVEQLSSILEQIVSPETLEGIRKVAQAGGDRCHFSDELWVKTIYDFAASFHRSVMNRDHLLQALTPVYRGRISSYLLENHGASLEEIQARMESLEQEYERLKPYLVQTWSSPGAR